MKEISRNCRISGKETKRVFTLGDIYMSDFVPKDSKDYEKNKCELALNLCEESGLLQLETTIPQDKMYGKYWYRSGINETMKRELKDVADKSMSSIRYKKGDIFLDIACNDGTMFDYISDDFIKIGIDPCDDSYYSESSKRADLVIQDYFSSKAYKESKYGNQKAKIITTIAMFYDLEDPINFSNQVKEILDDDGLWVIQLSYTPLMLEQLAFDNICHEHICYYSLSSMKYLMDKVGFDIVDCTLNDVNGGSFRVYLMKKGSNKNIFRNQQKRDVANFRVKSLLEYEKSLKLDDVDVYQEFFTKITKLKDDTTSFINNVIESGKIIHGYGASTKGSTLLQWFNLDKRHVKAIAERSKYKFGLKTSETEIPIIPESEMRKERPDYLLIMPWHFIYEFSHREKRYLKNGGKFIIPCPQFKVMGYGDFYDE